MSLNELYDSSLEKLCLGSVLKFSLLSFCGKSRFYFYHRILKATFQDLIPQAHVKHKSFIRFIVCVLMRETYIFSVQGVINQPKL